jgi:hypothetical protein
MHTLFWNQSSPRERGGPTGLTAVCHRQSKTCGRVEDRQAISESEREKESESERVRESESESENTHTHTSGWEAPQRNVFKQTTSPRGIKKHIERDDPGECLLTSMTCDRTTSQVQPRCDDRQQQQQFRAPTSIIRICCCLVVAVESHSNRCFLPITPGGTRSRFLQYRRR